MARLYFEGYFETTRRVPCLERLMNGSVLLLSDDDDGNAGGDAGDFITVQRFGYVWLF